MSSKKTSRADLAEAVARSITVMDESAAPAVVDPDRYVLQDERTPHLSLPLPYISNYLQDDVGRLRQAMTDVDRLLQAAITAQAALQKALDDLPNHYAAKAHKSAHAKGGSDALTPADIGAAAASHVTALATASAAGHVTYGTAAGTACQGNDARLSNARTPKAHKATHKAGGTDALTPADIGAAASAVSITAGNGLTGGGQLTGNVTLAAKLLDSVASTDTTSAGTANAVKVAYDTAVNALSVASSAQTVAGARAPMPQGGAGVGQWVSLNVVGDGTTLPAGGTWIFAIISRRSAHPYVDTSASGFAAGGGSFTLGAGLLMGWAWRIA